MNITPIVRRGQSASERLREIIRASGMSGSEVAARAGISHTIINRFLNGTTSMTFANFDKVAPVLRVRLVAGASRAGGSG